MNQRSERTNNKRVRLENMAEVGRLWCNMHAEYLTPEVIRDKKCYQGRHGKQYCKYIRMELDKR